MSRYYDGVIKGMSKAGTNLRKISQCVELLRYIDDLEELRKASDIVLRDIRMLIIYEVEDDMGNKVDMGTLYQLYRKALLISARVSFDSFMLYIELDREPKKRFYSPRRLQLKDIVDGLQAMADGELDELFLSQPARTGKTMLVRLFTVWMSLREPEKHNLYVSYGFDVAKMMYNGILEILNDPYTYKWKDVFPQTTLEWTDAKAGALDIDRKKTYHTITCRSLYGALNGSCDADGLLIADDLISGVEEAKNKDRLANAWLKVSNDMMPRKKESCKIIWIGTRWSLVDPIAMRIDTLTNEPEYADMRWKIVNVPALDEETDESNFEYKFGVGFSTEYYRRVRAEFMRNNDMASWMTQFMGQPMERAGAVFENGDMQYYNGDISGEQIVRTYAVIDTAWGGGDSLSMPIAVDTESGNTFVIDWVFNTGDKKVTRPLVTNAIIKYGVEAITVEANNGGGEYAEDIDEMLKEKGYRCNIMIKPASTKKRKEQRIFDRAPEIRELYFLGEGKRSGEYSKAMTELFSFTMLGKNKHDDAPDSLSMLIEMRETSGVRTKIIDRRKLRF